MIHVIVMAYNHEEFIAQCIDGILKQKTSAVLKVTVIDDASTDSTASIVRNIVETNPKNVSLETSDRNYRGSLRHPVMKVMKNSLADFLAFCDGDDFWIDELKLEKQLRLAIKQPNVGLIHTNYSILSSEGFDNPPVNRSFSQIRKAGKINSAFDLIKGNDIKHSTVFVRRKFLDLNFLDGSERIIPKDWLMYIDVLSKSYAAFIDEVTTVHRSHKGGLWNGSITQEQKIMKEQVRWFCASQVDDIELRNAFKRQVTYDFAKLRLTESKLYKIIRPLVLVIRIVLRRIKTIS